MKKPFLSKSVRRLVNPAALSSCIDFHAHYTFPTIKKDYIFTILKSIKGEETGTEAIYFKGKLNDSQQMRIVLLVCFLVK